MAKLAEVAKQPSRDPVLSAAARKFLFGLLSLSGAARRSAVDKLLSGVEPRLLRVVNRYKIKSLLDVLGFEDINSFKQVLREQLESMELRKKTQAEFDDGTVGRQNDFLGKLFEIAIKNGPVSRLLETMTVGVLEEVNMLIRSAGDDGHVMWDATGKPVRVKSGFTRTVTGYSIDIETGGGDKASLDFGRVAFNADGQWHIPVPVEIKLPRASSGVVAQFLSLPERIAVAMRDRKQVVVYVPESEAAALRKRLGDAVGSAELLNGRSFVPVKLDPGKLVFSAEKELDPIALHRVLVRPDSHYWKPSDPEKLPLGRSDQFVIGRQEGRPISVEVSASDKGNGFNFWRVQVPAEKQFLLDIYHAVFEGGL